MKWFELLGVFTYTISKLIPKKNNRWIFGSWFGNSISDNSKSLYEYVIKNYPDIETVWITKDPDKYNMPNSILVKRNSLKSLKYIITAKVAVMNQGYGDFCALNFLGGCYKVQLWHGVAWKKIFLDAMPEVKTFKDRIIRELFIYINSYDLYIAPSNNYKKVIESAFNAPESKILMCGQPRNTNLFDEGFCVKTKKKVLADLGIKAGLIITYMPTFRDKTNDVFTFNDPDVLSLLKPLQEEHNFIIIEKSHFKTLSRRKDENDDKEEFLYVLPTIDAQTLLAATDILITDYSSCFFDYAIRNKPIIHFIYDYEYYKNVDRGLYYDIEEVCAGDVVYNVQGLLESLNCNLNNPNFNYERIKKIKRNFITFEEKDNNKIIVEHIKNASQ